jgi:uncharacterized membrane protein
MKNLTEDNTIEVVQKAIKFHKIRVCNTTVKEALKTNPYYPTFKSICSVLDEFNIENYALKYHPEEMKEIPAPYISHFNEGGGQLGFVSEIKDGIVTYYISLNHREVISISDFIKKCSGAVLLIYPSENSGENDYYINRHNELLNNSILPVLTSGIIFFTIVTLLRSVLSKNFILDLSEYFLLLTKIAGITLSIILVLHEFEIHFSLTDKLCHFNEITNCNTVLNDKASRAFGWISWADMGIIYFLSTLLIVIDEPSIEKLSLLALLSSFALPYPFYSVYYQGFVLKKWCPMCLGVQIILIIEFFILLPHLAKLIFSLSSLISFIQTFLIISVIYLLLIKILKENLSNELINSKYKGLKKIPEIFQSLIYKQKYFDIQVSKNSMIFGEKDSLLKVTAFISLHCSHCARAFEKIKKLIKSEFKASFHIVLISEDKKVLNTLNNLKVLNKDEEALELLTVWFNSVPFSTTKFSENLCKTDIDFVTYEVDQENIDLFRSCEVLGTPTFFINGYMLPNQYEIDDINYFSEIFLNKK